MQPLAQEAAQVLIVRAVAQPLLCNPPFYTGFQNIIIAPGRDRHEIELLGRISSGFSVKINFFLIQFRK